VPALRLRSRPVVTDSILVTGAAGFLGSQVVQQLRERGDHVVAVRHRWSDAEELAIAVGEDPIQRAVHLGWHTGPGYRHDAAANLAGFRASLELVELLSARECHHLVAIGTGLEYAPRERPVSEADELGPTDVYGAVKAALGILLTGPVTPAPFPVAWARVFNPGGPGERPPRVLPTVAAALARGDHVDLSDGEQQVDLLDVSDVAAGIVALSDLGRSGSWNIASGETHRLRDVIVSLATRVGDPAMLRFGIRSRDADRDCYVGDSTKLRTDTAWQPVFGLEAVLDRISEEWAGDPSRGSSTSDVTG
jgi:UDP-glucose 4-epimerase